VEVKRSSSVLVVAFNALRANIRMVEKFNKGRILLAGGKFKINRFSPTTTYTSQMRPMFTARLVVKA